MAMESATAMNMPTQRRLSEVLRSGIERLQAAGLERARLDAEVLLAHGLAMTREELVTEANQPLNAESVRRFDLLLERRLQREPVAYITGRKEFWSRELLVTPDVLIPRAETELAVEVILSLATAMPAESSPRLLDLGTGSGAIAVSLARELTTARIWAVDISTAALAVARSNAALNGVADRITFLAGDLFEALGAEPEGFDLIVSNPPYIRSEEILTLEPEVSRWEPRLALDGGADGLEFYRAMAARAWPFLTPGGAVAVEIGAAMGGEVVAIFDQAGRYRHITVVQDYAGRDRVVVAKGAAFTPRSD